MLTRIELRHFKCFEVLKLPLCPLTLLSGPNASGKSSVLQALVLLHQTMREHVWSMRLMLNGDAVRLGTVGDVIDQVHGRRSCEISLLDGEAGYFFHWEFDGERAEMSMAVRQVRGGSADGAGWAKIASRTWTKPSGSARCCHTVCRRRQAAIRWTNRLRRLSYLTAERLGPRENYPLEDPQLMPVVGPRGEHAVSVLHSGRDERVLQRLGEARGVKPPSRLRQVEHELAKGQRVFTSRSTTTTRLTNPNLGRPRAIRRDAEVNFVHHSVVMVH